MSLIFPSLNFVASDYLNDANGKPSLCAFTRPTQATYVNNVGLVATASSGNLRHDYSPITGAYNGWLFEEQRTNLFLYSSAIEDASWAKQNSAVSANVSTSPSGSSDADKVVEDSSASTYHRIVQSISATSGTIYTISGYSKISDAGRPYLLIETTGGLPTAATYFNISTGVVTSSSHAAQAITTMPNGWVRWSITTTATSTASSAIYIYATPTSSGNSWSGDGSSGMLLWGLQAEAGAFISSYIPTTGASATRNADLLTIPTSSFGFNNSEGTLYVNFTANAIGITTGCMRIYGGGGSYTIYRNSSNNVVFDLNDGAAIGSSSGTTSVSIGSTIIVAASYRINDSSIITDGGAAQVVPSSRLPSSVSTLEIGGGALGTGPLNGTIRHIAYFPRRITNSDLQTITK